MAMSCLALSATASLPVAFVGVEEDADQAPEVHHKSMYD